MAKILVIEDDPHSADIAARVLKRRGHEVLVASEGLTGLKIASQEQVDLVLLDLGLPDIGGHTIAALINRIPGNIPVVAVTASTDMATQKRAMSYGCDGYITKPIDTRAFPDQVAQFIRSKESSPSTDGRGGSPTQATQETKDEKPAGASTEGKDQAATQASPNGQNKAIVY
jgi:DNA-binding response OmpR family regulator